MHLNNSLNDQTHYFTYHFQLKTKKKKKIPFSEFFFHYVYGGFSSKVTFMVVADTIPSWGSDLKPLTPYLSVGGGQLIDGRLPENHSKQCYPCSCMGTKWLQLCPTFCDCGL